MQALMKPMRLTVIIPAYNEALSLPGTVLAINNFLSRWHADAWQIIIVDDGSIDGTLAVANNLKGQRVSVISLPRNLGKGAALVAGAQATAEGYILLMDADSSTPISELNKLWKNIESADVVFGSRSLVGSTITRHQPWYRELAGRFGNKIIQVLLLPGVIDSQCGFKLLSPSVLPLLQAVRTQRWGFDVELLSMAKTRGLSILEVPITWQHDDSSAVGVGSYVRTLLEVVRIWWWVKVLDRTKDKGQRTENSEHQNTGTLEHYESLTDD
jgi:dolichyl-phosphate beta-glucosyltransferase